MVWKDRLNLNRIKTDIMNAQANLVTSGANVTNAKAWMISAEASKKNASTNALWTPVGIGAGIAGFGMSKIRGFMKHPVGFR